MRSRFGSREPSAIAPKIELVATNKGDPLVKQYMAVHYTQPKGFVGRQLIYRIECGGKVYGAIAGGSAIKLPKMSQQLAGRVFPEGATLENVVNNTFFHLERPEGESYPVRNFAPKVVALWRERVMRDWPARYKGDRVMLFETLIEPPRTGELYLRDGWTHVGTTHGTQWKREGGSSPKERFKYGVRVRDRKAPLRPKLVFTRLP